MTRIALAGALIALLCGAAQAEETTVYRAEGDGFVIEIEEPGLLAPRETAGRAIGFARELGSFELAIARPPLALTPTWTVNNRLYVAQGFSMRMNGGGCRAENPARPDRITFSLHGRTFEGCGGKTSEPVSRIAGDAFTLQMFLSRFVFKAGGEEVGGALHQPSYPAYFGEDYRGVSDDGREIHIGFIHERCREAGRSTRVEINFDAREFQTCIPAVGPAAR